MNPSLDLYRAFWNSVATHLAFDPLPRDRRIAALQWVGQSAASEERASRRREIASALEDSVLQSVRLLKLDGLDEAAQLVIRMMWPLLDSPLAADADPTFRRLVAYLVRLKGQARAVRTYRVSVDGKESAISVLEEEIDLQAAAALKSLIEGREPSGRVHATGVEVVLDRDVPDTDIRANIRADVPWVHMLLLEERAPLKAVIESIKNRMWLTDPPMYSAVADLDAALDSPNVQAAEAIRRFVFQYLSSTSLSLKRDPRGTLKRLAEQPIKRLDAYIGAGDIQPDISAPALIQRLLDDSDRVPASALQTFVILTIPYEQQRAAAAGILELLPKQRSDLVVALVRDVWATYHPFRALWSLFVLLICAAHEQYHFELNGQQIDLRAWTTSQLLILLARPSERPKDHTRAEMMERYRRTAHAASLRLALWIAGNSRHSGELRALGMPESDIVRASLIRGLLLVERILPVFIDDTPWHVMEVPERLGELERMLGLDAVNSSLYPDLMNPWIFGPDAYDHVLTTLLALLEGIVAAEDAGPYWYTPEVAAALNAIVQARRTPEEEQLVADRSQGKPNRLGVVLSRIPEEIAKAILAMCASKGALGRAL